MSVDEDSLDVRLTSYAPERTNLLPALHDVQETLGYLAGWALERVGKQLHVPASEVYGVATGYPEFRFESPAAGLFQVCTGLSCRLAGADALLREARERRAEAIESIPCLFLCALAPVVAHDDRFFGHIDSARLIALQEEEMAAEAQYGL